MTSMNDQTETSKADILFSKLVMWQIRMCFSVCPLFAEKNNCFYLTLRQNCCDNSIPSLSDRLQTAYSASPRHLHQK